MMRRRPGWGSLMNKVRLTPEAVRDLAEIRRYISEELANPSAAQHVVSSITENIHLLERRAMMGQSTEALTGHPMDFYIPVFGKYIALYRAEGSIVSVARVINARQDYIRLLFGDISPSTQQNT